MDGTPEREFFFPMTEREREKVQYVWKVNCFQNAPCTDVSQTKTYRIKPWKLLFVCKSLPN